ncbi:MAG: single-stranded DNA-binding protein [Aquiluna sp.]|nr:single-stranded DNA-binding protein [Aquiluna sp.]
MADSFTVVGLVATTPRNIITSDGLPVTSFRLASSARRFDKQTSQWIDADTNWFSVVAFRQLAENTNNSICKGDRVLVSGRLKVRDWDNGERTGTTVEVEAEAIGHDLLFGTSTFERVSKAAENAEDSEPALQPA